MLLPAKPKEQGTAGEILAELLSEISQLKGTEWTIDTWRKSNLDWMSFTNNYEMNSQIIQRYVSTIHRNS